MGHRRSYHTMTGVISQLGTRISRTKVPEWASTTAWGLNFEESRQDVSIFDLDYGLGRPYMRKIQLFAWGGKWGGKWTDYEGVIIERRGIYYSISLSKHR